MIQLPRILLLVTCLSVASTTPAAGCIGPPIADLWRLVEEADLIVVASAESATPTAFSRFLIHLNDSALKAGELVDRVSPDLAMLLGEYDDWIPEAQGLSYAAKLRVVETLHGSSPTRYRVTYSSWGPAVIPGQQAVVFLKMKWGSPVLLDYLNSTIYPRDSDELKDLLS